MSTNDNIRRRALLGATRNTDAHECMVEYEFPRSDLANRSDIYKYTFGPSNITNVNWPSGIKHIFRYSFCNSRITASTFNSMPSTVEQIDQYAFYTCDNIAGAITFPSSLQFLWDYAFAYNEAVTSISLSGLEITIGASCFYGCNNLSTINISENATLALMGTSTFGSTAWLTNKSNGNVYLGKNYYQYKGTMPANTSVALEEGTLSISSSAFSGKSQLKSITIPDTVKFIGSYAFSGCTGLTSITIPRDLSYELYNSFSSAIQLTNISASGGGGTTATPYSPFYSTACSGITTINWNAVNGWGGSNNSAIYCFLGGGTYIPNVTTINFGSEVEFIPNYLCYGLKKLTSITIPSSVKFLGYYAFGNCTGLTSMTIPETVDKIHTSGYIFNGCTGLTTLNYNAISCKKWNLFDSTEVVNSNKNCWGITSNLTTINIGNQVQVIPGGFLGSAQFKITSITIPNSVTTLKSYSFYQSNLTSIDLPASVTSIGNYAFYNCSSLTSITIRSTTPPTLDSSYSYTFPTTSQSYTIYVPASVVNTYKTTSKWSTWASKIQAIPN